MKLTKMEIAGLLEFKNKGDAWECRWKPKTMKRLLEKGLVSAHFARFEPVVVYRITDSGREELARILAAADD